MRLAPSGRAFQESRQLRQGVLDPLFQCFGFGDILELDVVITPNAAGLAAVSVSFDYDRFANLNLRTRGGGGAGVQVLQEPKYKWRIEAGVEYTNEDLRGAPDERYAAARIATIFQWDPAKWFRFREFAEYFPNLEKGSDFTFRSESMLSVDLWGGFGLGISVIVAYDETPAPRTCTSGCRCRSCRCGAWYPAPAR